MIKGLSARLLLLTVVFVMLAEVLIFAPSVARFRQEYFLEHIRAANLAILTVDATADGMVSEDIKRELLRQVGAHAISVRRQGMKLTLASDTVPPVTETIAAADQPPLTMIHEAVRDLITPRDAVLRVVAPSPTNPAIEVEVIIDQRPLSEELRDFGRRILYLSLAISIITAGLVFIALRWLLVRPMRRITENMVAFREDPEDGTRVISPSGRQDEVGIAERELADMQHALRQYLQQKEHLAALGTAVAKINHDLKGVLSSAILVFDRLEDSEDPEVRKIAPGLTSSIERAVQMLSQTLNYVGAEQPRIERSEFPLAGLIEEVASGLRNRLEIKSAVPDGLRVAGDRAQMYRVFDNLFRNAAEAGASKIEVSSHHYRGTLSVDVADDGPGLSPRAQENLFKAFKGSTRRGGSGLGLAIARELMRGQGGDLALESTSGEGTCFRITLFLDQV